jgi:hypothetical protein
MDAQIQLLVMGFLSLPLRATRTTSVMEHAGHQRRSATTLS